jgi:hypothetical protein
MNNDIIPCCEISSEKSVEKECVALCPFYTLYYPLHSLAASLQHFYNSEGQRISFFYKRTKNPCCQLTTFYAVYCPFHSVPAILYGFTLVCGLQAKRSSGKKEERETHPIRFYAVLYTLTLIKVRLKKVHGFYKGFLRFSSVRNVFPRFSH